MTVAQNSWSYDFASFTAWLGTDGKAPGTHAIRLSAMEKNTEKMVAQVAIHVQVQDT